MNCPKCGKKMILKNKDFSYDFRAKPKKKYIRTVYWCMDDDIWINIETPAKKS